MKKFSGIILSLIAVFGFVQTGMAQLADIPTPKRQAKRMSEVMAKKLQLSKKQKEEVLALNLKLAKQENQLLNNEDMDFFKRREKLAKIPEIRAQKLKNILNKQQYQKYREFNNRTRSDSLK